MFVSGSFDTTIKLWDTVIHKEITTLIGHIDFINSICFSPCGTEW